MFLGTGGVPVAAMNPSPFGAYEPPFCSMLPGQLNMQVSPVPAVDPMMHPRLPDMCEQELYAAQQQFLPLHQHGSFVSWNHAVPSCLPWFQPDCPFLAGDAQRRGVVVTCKRKGVHLDDSPSACKQFVSEEVMAARMKQLHISDSQQFPQSTEILESNMLEKVEPSERLVVLSPELKKLQDEPILPKSILEKLSKPSMELVLWRPPGGVVDQFIKNTLAQSTLRKIQKKEDADEPMGDPSWDAFSIQPGTLSKFDVEKVDSDAMC